MTDEMKAHLEEIMTLVYLGYRLNEKGVLRHIYQHAIPDGDGMKTLGVDLVFTRKLYQIPPGCVIRGKRKDDYFYEFEYVKQWPDEKQRFLWQADSRAAQENKSLISQKKKTENFSELDEHVEALREAIGRMTSQERKAFVAWLLTRFLKYG